MGIRATWGAELVFWKEKQSDSSTPVPGHRLVSASTSRQDRRGAAVSAGAQGRGCSQCGAGEGGEKRVFFFWLLLREEENSAILSGSTTLDTTEVDYFSSFLIISPAAAPKHSDLRRKLQVRRSDLITHAPMPAFCVCVRGERRSG